MNSAPNFASTCPGLVMPEYRGVHSRYRSLDALDILWIDPMLLGKIDGRVDDAVRAIAPA